jgi:hypothetical protein
MDDEMGKKLEEMVKIQEIINAILYEYKFIFIEEILKIDR